MGYSSLSGPIRPTPVARAALLILAILALLSAQSPVKGGTTSQPTTQTTPAASPTAAEKQPGSATAAAPAADQNKTTPEQKPGAAPEQPRAGATPLPCSNSCDSVSAWWRTFTVITVLFGLMLLLSVLGLGRAALRGRWSLSDALSEESSYQPSAITSKADVIMLASSSRLIAFMGLLGILGVVVGTGYSIIWNLFVRGAPPSNLGELRSFLLGAATLFAPYLANQLRAAFDTTGAATPAKSAPPAPKPAAPAPSAVGPPAPTPPATAPPTPAPGVPVTPAESHGPDKSLSGQQRVP